MQSDGVQRSFLIRDPEIYNVIRISRKYLKRFRNIGGIDDLKLFRNIGGIDDLKLFRNIGGIGDLNFSRNIGE